jgi:lipopolysaccharide transport system permease protein
MPKEGLPALLFKVNPLTPLILTARDWLTGVTPEYLGYFIVVNIVALPLLFLLWAVFRLAMPILIERMGN